MSTEGYRRGKGRCLPDPLIPSELTSCRQGDKIPLDAEGGAAGSRGRLPGGEGMLPGRIP